MAAPVLGIDLGTTNSVVAVVVEGEVRVLTDRDGRRLLASAVSFHPDGDVLVGHLARSRRQLGASDTVYGIKRLLGRPFDSEEVRLARSRFAFELVPDDDGTTLVKMRDRLYTLTEISALVLRHVRTIAETALGHECARAVITVPANFSQLQRRMTKAAGQVAGLDVLRILNEPTAAALAYGYSGGSNERIAVYDLGGGTFDLTILELAGDVFEVVATAGDMYLGGDDIDLSIAERLADVFKQKHGADPRDDRQAFERLRAAAEKAKCRLSTNDDVEVRVDSLAIGSTTRDLDYRLSKSELEALIEPVVSRTLRVCKNAMSQAGIGIEDLQNVILVGGSTRIPFVRERVAEHFSRAPLATMDPDLLVSHGAAVYGAALGGAQTAVNARPIGASHKAREEVEEQQRKRAMSEVTRPFTPESGIPREAFETPTVSKRSPFADAEDAFEQQTTSPDRSVDDLPLEYQQTAAGARAVRDDSSGPRFLRDEERLELEPTSPGAAGLEHQATATGHEVAAIAAEERFDFQATQPGGRSANPYETPTAPVQRPLLEDPWGDIDALGDTAPRGKPLASPPETAPRGTLPPAGTKPPPHRAQQQTPVAADTFGSGTKRGMPRLPADDLTTEPTAVRRSAVPRDPADEDLTVEPTGVRKPVLDPEVGFDEYDGLPPTASPPQGSFDEYDATPGTGTGRAPAVLFHDDDRPSGGFDDHAGATPAGSLPPNLSGASSVRAASSAAAIPLPDRPPPLLLDVTAHTLGVETSGGWCEAVIPHSAPIPVEQSRVFSTAVDDQDTVRVRVCQGEALRYIENEHLGEFELSGLRRAPRGAVHIEVTFILDADGTLSCSARDVETGNAQRIRISLLGDVDDRELEELRRRHDDLYTGSHRISGRPE